MTRALLAGLSALALSACAVGPNYVSPAPNAPSQQPFVSADGVRCTERGYLEFDHSMPVARGGQPTVEVMRLLCKAPEASPRSRRKMLTNPIA